MNPEVQCVWFLLFFFITEKTNVVKDGDFLFGGTGFGPSAVGRQGVEQRSLRAWTSYLQQISSEVWKIRRKQMEKIGIAMELLCFYAFFNLLELTYGLGFRVSLPKTRFESMIFPFPFRWDM